MPAMGPPYCGWWPDTARTEASRMRGRSSCARSLRVRLRTAVHRGRLTHALADGANPKASDELALRARQLISERNRRILARSLCRAMAQARQRPHARTRMTIVNRGAVLDAEAAMMEMIERLDSPIPVQPQGMALLTLILTNADRSPLYNAREPGTLRRMIRSATAALDAHPARSHEFALAV